MAKPIVMPKPGITVEECILSKWHKSVGDTINKGDLLFSYETDKASFDEISEETGELLAVFYNEGDDVPALNNICVIGTAGEEVSEFAPDVDGTETATAVAEAPKTTAPVVSTPQVVPSAAPAVAATAVSKESNVAETGSGGVSPRAKGLAERNGISVSNTAGSGPNGRVIERDVLRVMAKGADTATFATVPASEDIPHTNIRKVIAKAMHASLSGMAQLTLNSSFDATEILKLRASFKQSKKPQLEKITLNDIVLYAVVKMLLKHPEINAHYYDDLTRRFNTVNLGVAVDTDKGLMVPKLMAAESMTLPELSAEMKSVAAAAQSGNINPDLLAGGTFTVTNLGNLGVESFTPVINPPEVGILGVCSLNEKIKIVNGMVTGYQSMGLSLTFDHRALDGAPAARFLKDVCDALENFSLLLVD